MENAYNIQRRFRVHTSNEQLVSVENEYYDIQALDSVPILLNFNSVKIHNLPLNLQVCLLQKKNNFLTNKILKKFFFR